MAPDDEIDVAKVLARSQLNPKSTSSVYVTPARAVVETTCEIVALMSRTTMGSGVDVPAMIGGPLKKSV